MDDQSTPQFMLQGKELLEHLAERAAHDAKAEVLAREERRNRTLSMMIAVLGLVGIGALVGGLKLIVGQEMQAVYDQIKGIESKLEKQQTLQADRLREELTERVQGAVLAEMGQQIGEVRTILARNDQFERFAEIAMRLPEQLSGIHRRQDKYVTASIGEALDAVRQVATLKEFTNRTRFAVAVRQIVGVMTRYNRVAEIDEMDDLVGEVMLRDEQLIRSLVDHYGQLVVGAATEPDNDPQHVAKLLRYASAAGQFNQGDKELVWRLFLEFKRNHYQRCATTDGLLESSQDLAAEDRTEFWYDLYLYSEPTLWLLAIDQQGRELQRLMAAMIKEYPIVAKMMEQNIASNPTLQSDVADRRTRKQAIYAASGEANPDPDPTPQETASGSNSLRR